MTLEHLDLPIIASEQFLYLYLPGDIGAAAGNRESDHAKSRHRLAAGEDDETAQQVSSPKPDIQRINAAQTADETALPFSGSEGNVTIAAIALLPWCLPIIDRRPLCISNQPKKETALKSLLDSFFRKQATKVGCRLGQQIAFARARIYFLEGWPVA